MSKMAHGGWLGQHTQVGRGTENPPCERWPRRRGLWGLGRHLRVAFHFLQDQEHSLDRMTPVDIFLRDEHLLSQLLARFVEYEI